MTHQRTRFRPRPTRRRDESGYVALLVAVLVPTVFLGLAATAVDTARWYLEVERVQQVADAAAMAGVPYLPQDLPNATATARDVAKRNGYDNAAAGTDVGVQQGARDSQLRVTISSKVTNQFGRFLGMGSTAITRTAVADYTGPAPMGSPCNTFGNEPTAGGRGGSPSPTGTARGANPYANCSSDPQLWATVQGPETDKRDGDRYQTRRCSSRHTQFCGTVRSGENDEYAEVGYFWAIKVQKEAVGRPLTVQLYDPAFVHTGSSCTALPASNAPYLTNLMNPWVNDAVRRYSRLSIQDSAPGMAPYCNGDYLGSTNLMTTSFAVREQTDTLDPMQGAVQTDTVGEKCIKQYTGQKAAPTVNDLRSASTSYDDQLARVFHNWTELCTFTPAREGDYYLQVRTNVAAGGQAAGNTNGNPKVVYTGNEAVGQATGNLTRGSGNNSFAIRAVTDPGLENYVSVSGHDRMPIFANADSADSSFNLIRILPGAAGQYISFSFYDAGDASGTGSVQVLPPGDATGSVRTTPYPGGCKAKGGRAGAGGATYYDCKAPISNSETTGNNGRVEEMTIPIPTDYSCNHTSLGGCWYKVRVKFDSGATVNDITTWDAKIVGDPVRLIE